MNTVLLIIILVVSKVLLKAIAPYTNRALNNKTKEVFKHLLEYIDYCRIWWK